MGSLTFEQLGHRCCDILQENPDNFFAITDALENFSKHNTIALFNHLLFSISNNDKLSSSEEEHIYLFQQAGIHLLIRFARTEYSVKTLLASDVDAIIINLSTKPLRIPCYRSDINKADLAKRPACLVPTDDVMLNSYQPYQLPAFTSILDFYAASHDAPLLIIHSDKYAWSTWSFDRTTLNTIKRISTDLRASRIHLTLQLLQAMHVKNIEPVLEPFILSDYAGNVRWDAAKYYYEMNKDKAINTIKHLAQYDADPAVQRAALQSLKGLNN